MYLMRDNNGDLNNHIEVSERKRSRCTNPHRENYTTRMNKLGNRKITVIFSQKMEY